ncbi:hypothetical protein A4X06_0g9542, partial [Tilletia controversa]
MSVWQLLARYIALWELAQLGYFVLDDDEDSWYEDCRMDGVHTLLEVKNEVKRMSKYDEENLHEILSSSSMRIMSWQRLDALAEPDWGEEEHYWDEEQQQEEADGDDIGGSGDGAQTAES